MLKQKHSKACVVIPKHFFMRNTAFYASYALFYALVHHHGNILNYNYVLYFIIVCNVIYTCDGKAFSTHHSSL